MTNPLFIVLVGLPGSGKSTYTKIAVECDPTTVIVSTDGIIENFAAHHGKTYDEVWEEAIKPATKLAQSKMELGFKARSTVIIDQTNLGMKKRKKLLSQVPEGYTKIACYFEIDEELRQQRLKARPGKTIPAHIDAQMAASYLRPETHEGFDAVYYGEWWDLSKAMGAAA